MVWANQGSQKVKINAFDGTVQNQFLRYLTPFSSDKRTQRVISQENSDGKENIYSDDDEEDDYHYLFIFEMGLEQETEFMPVLLFQS